MAGDQPRHEGQRAAGPSGLKRALTAKITQAWTHRGGLALLMWPISLLYGAAVAWRRWNFSQGTADTHRVKARVIIVGNVVAGGAGKTPVVMALVAHLQARGLQVGVVSRGHGRSTTDCREVLPSSPATEVGDEPALIQRKTQVPVFVALQRSEAALALLAQYPETQVIVSDDGLQHYALQRDLEICVMDDRGIGNGFLLPAGPLREPWPRRPMGSANSKNRESSRLWPPIETLLLHTGQRPAMAHGFRSGRALASHALRADGSTLALASLSGQTVQAVAAIAQPQAFFDMLQSAGLTLTHTDALPDHADFAGWTPQPVPAGASPMPILCTEKDAVKLWASHPEAWAVPLELSLEPAFLAAVDREVAGWALRSSLTSSNSN